MKKPVIDQDILSLCKELGVKSPINLVGRKIYFSYISPSNNANVHVCSSISKVTFEHKSMFIFLNEDSYPFPRRIFSYYFQEKNGQLKAK